jgi:hypothetical protein
MFLYRVGVPRGGAYNETAINKATAPEIRHIYCCSIISIFINILFVDIHCKMVRSRIHCEANEIQLRQLTQQRLNL